MGDNFGSKGGDLQVYYGLIQGAEKGISFRINQGRMHR